MTGLEVVASILLLTGSAFALLGAVGLHRFADVFSRMHAATKPVTLGLACALLGAALVKDDLPSAAKLLLAAGLQFITAPVGAHMVGRAAYRAGGQMAPGYQVDELEGVDVEASVAAPRGRVGDGTS